MESSPQKKRRFRRRFLIILLPVLLFAGLLFSLASSSGSAAAVQATLALVSRFTRWELQAGELKGSLYTSLAIGKLAISDEEGLCFELEDLFIEPLYRDLLKGRISLTRAEIGSVTMLRPPVKKKKWRIPTIPRLVYHLSVDHLELSRLQLPEAGPGGDHPLSLKGQIHPAAGKQLPELFFSLESLESDAVDGRISFFYDGDAPRLEGHLEDTSLLPAMLNLSPPLRVVLHGEGPREHWEAGITVQARDLLLAEGSLLLREGEAETLVSGTGKAFLSRIPPLASVVPYLGDKLEGQGQCRLNTQGEFSLDEAGLQSGKLNLSAKSTLALPALAGRSEVTVHYSFEESEAPCELLISAESDGSTLHYTLSGDQDGRDFLSGKGQLLIGEESKLSGTLDLYPGRLPVAQIPFRAEENIRSSFDLHYDNETARLSLHKFALTGRDLESALSGWVNLEAEAFDFNGEASLSGMALFELGEEIPLEGSFRGQFHASSEEEGAEAGLSLQGNGLRWADWAVDSLQLETTLLSESWRRVHESNWLGELSLDCTDMAAPSSGEEEGSSLEDLQVTLSVKGQGFEAISCPAIQLRSGTASVTGEGLIELKESLGQVKLAVECPDTLELTSPFVSLPSLAFTAEVESQLSWMPLQLDSSLQGKIRENDSTDPDLAQWLGSDGLSFDISLEATEESVTLREGKISHALGRVLLEGTHSLSDHSFVFAGNLDAPELSGIGELVDQEISGQLAVKAQLTGDLEGFQGEITVDASSVKVSHSAPLNLALELLGEGPLRTPELRWLGSVKGEGAPVLLAGKGSLGEDSFTLNSFSLKDGTNEATLSGVIPFAVYDTTLQGQVKAPNLAQIGALIDFPLSGSGEGALTLADKKLESHLHCHDLQAGAFQGGTVSLKARAEGLDQNPSGRASLEMESLTLGQVKLNSLRGEVAGDLALATFQLQVNESSEQEEVSPLTVNLASELSVKEGKGLLTTLTAGAGASLFSLKENAQIIWSPPEFSLSPLRLESTNGCIQAEALAGSDEIRASLTLSALPLSLLETAGFPAASGMVQGELSLLGCWEDPQLKGRVQVEDALLEDEGLGSLPPANAEINLALMNGRLQMDSSVVLDPGLNSRAELSFPLELSLRPWRLHFDEDNDLAGKLSFETDFQPLLKGLALIPHAMEGKMAGEFTVDGSLSEPRISGEASLQDGQYTNISTGTNLHRMQLRLTAADDTLIISECSAQAGQQGTLTVEGSVLLDLENNFPLSMTVALDHAQVVHLAYATAVVDGPLSLKGNLKDMLLSGELEISPVEATMPDQLMLREPTRLEIVEMGQEEEEEAAPSPFADLASSIRLDINCSMPRKIYARAPILDSEWSGLFHVGGDLSDPRAEGRVAARRGNLDFLNQRFELTNSAILFTGKSIMEPTLDMRAQVETKEISATVRLEGELDTIAMKLESSPSLPQDEILSHILFGKDLARISPVQAIQLARVAAMFNRDLGGLRFFSGNVSISGIDRIDLRTGEKIDDAAVGLGKYFTDSVYVEVEQGTASDSGRISVEVELSPQLSIKGDVDARDRSGVGLFWRKDY
ncbi:MAG: hypothetical protein GX130_06060 [Candidatus Hydrogenedens sp.]|jgi:translocation and assembly module TamB|nr:hypothetical protein [Candidatus Hydrogenedens sp.]